MIYVRIQEFSKESSIAYEGKSGSTPESVNIPSKPSVRKPSIRSNSTIRFNVDG